MNMNPRPTTTTTTTTTTTSTTLAELSNHSFTYPNWKEDAKKCEKCIFESFSLAETYIKGMTNKQLIHENRCIDPTIIRIQSDEFTYQGFEQDKQIVMEEFGNGWDVSEKIIVFELKQMVHIGDRSHPMLEVIDNASATFDYNGWEVDLDKVRLYLFDLHRSCHSLVRYKLDLMHKKQVIYSKGFHDPIMRLLVSGKFTYPSFGEDKEKVMELYQKNGEDVDELIDFIKLRQNIHDGICSHPILDTLKTSCFSYTNWRQDDRATKAALLQGPICNSFSSSMIYNVERRLKSMTIKQKIHEGRDCMMIFVESGLFTYDSFEKDRRRLVNDYVNHGFDVDTDLERMIEKQKFHNGQRSHPILSILGNALDNSDDDNDHSYNDGYRYSDSNNENVNDYNLDSCKEHEHEHDHKKNGDVVSPCIICLEQPKTHAFVPCGHVALCGECAELPNFSSVGGDNECPICRDQSMMLMRVYI